MSYGSSRATQLRFAAAAATIAVLGIATWAALKYYTQRPQPEADGAEAQDGAVAPAASNPGSVVQSCASCGKPATLKCSRCKTVVYCNKNCQTEHWKLGHKKQCAEAIEVQRLAAKQRDVEGAIREVSYSLDTGKYRQALQQMDRLLKLVQDCTFPLALLHAWCASSPPQ